MTREYQRPWENWDSPEGLLISSRPRCYASMFSWTWGRSELEMTLGMIWPNVLLPQMSKFRPKKSHLSGVAQRVRADLDPEPRSHETQA